MTATDALELGIDIGLLDCAISVGFPGTVASLRQQWGRAGRRGHGLAVLVASEDALDQYFMREPEMLLGRRVEAAILDHANPRVLDGHVRAAAFEAPLDDADRATLGDAGARARRRAPRAEANARRLRLRRAATTPPAQVGLRSAGAEAFTVVDATDGAVLGIVERERAYSTVHEGAVYLHLGESYLVLALDHDARTALVEPFRGDWYTQAKTRDHDRDRRAAARRAPLRPRAPRSARSRSPSRSSPSSASRSRGGETLETVPLDLPATTFETEAVWFLPEPEQLEGLTEMPRLLGTLHAAEHAMIALLPLWAMCDRWDIGGLSTNVHFQTGRPTVFVYDGHAGGVGIAERGFERVRGLGRGHGAHARGLPVRRRLPVLRPVPEVREPQRAARQGGRAGVPAPTRGGRHSRKRRSPPRGSSGRGRFRRCR